jgi:molybdate transport system regulatory protein
MAKIMLRIDLSPTRAVGPGKIRLLECIEQTGSISGAGREMEMSYRRAWLLVEEINSMFKKPAVTTKLGGNSGGGAAVTAFGRSLIRHYRAMEAEAEAALGKHLAALDDARAERPPRRKATSAR